MMSASKYAKLAISVRKTRALYEKEKDRIEKTMRAYKPNELPELNRPIVYGWKRNDQYLYIGQSKKGTKRLLNHEIIDGRIMQGDLITIWLINSVEKIDKVEIYFIMKYNPIHNLRHNNQNNEPVALFNESNERICLNCKALIGDKSNKKFCNNKCRNKYWKDRYNISKDPNLEKIEALVTEIDKLII